MSRCGSGRGLLARRAVHTGWPTPKSSPQPAHDHGNVLELVSTVAERIDRPPRSEVASRVVTEQERTLSAALRAPSSKPIANRNRSARCQPAAGRPRGIDRTDAPARRLTAFGACRRARLSRQRFANTASRLANALVPANRGARALSGRGAAFAFARVSRCLGWRCLMLLVSAGLSGRSSLEAVCSGGWLAIAGAGCRRPSVGWR